MSMRYKLVGAWLILLLVASSTPSVGAEESGVGIEEVFAALQRDLDKMQADARKSKGGTSFRVHRATLRVQFVMIRETEPDGKERLKIVPVEAGKNYSPRAIHTLNLLVEPISGRQAVSPRRPGTAPSRRERAPSPMPETQPESEPQPQPDLQQEPQPAPKAEPESPPEE